MQNIVRKMMDNEEKWTEGERAQMYQQKERDIVYDGRMSEGDRLPAGLH